MAIAQNFPSVLPTLNLSFALTKALDPRITYARASAATYYGTDTAKAEENLFERSQELDNVYWLKSRATVSANDTTAPNGTLTAEALIQQSGETASGFIRRSSNTVSAGDYVVSIFAKPNGKNFLTIQERLANDSFNSTFFDVNNGTIGTGSVNHTATITSAGNGWFRCSIKFTVNATRTQQVSFFIADTDNSGVVIDSGGLFLWGAQLEQRDSVTNYTPTTNQRITNFVPVLESAAAGEARFDHNPVTGESLGLLIEESRTNLLLRSEEFDANFWGKGRTSITENTIVAPSGELTGDKLVENTETGPHHAFVSFAFTSGTSFTASGYYKAAERTRFAMQLGNNGTPFPNQANHRAVFDLSTGTLVSAGASLTSTSITSVGNGWFRCSITAVAQATATDTLFQAFLILAGTQIISYTGDGFSGIFIWGASLEQAAFPTSYVKTTTAQVTRAADAASMTGANFSSFYNQAEGTFYLEAAALAQPAFFSEYLTISDGSDSNRHFITQPSNNLLISGRTTVNGVVQSAINAFTATIGQPFRFVYSYKTDDFAAVGNGGSVSVDTLGVLPVTNQMQIGGRPALSKTCYIRKIAYYPRRIANAELQGLTTV